MSKKIIYSEIDFIDPLNFVDFFIKTSNEKIETILKDYNMMKFDQDYFNFWLNFSTNFRDGTFISFIADKNQIYDNLKEIMIKIETFLIENLSSEG